MISPFRRPRPDRSSHVVNKIACKSSDFNVVFTILYFCWPPPAPSTVQPIPFFLFFANLGGTKPLLKMYVSTACPPSSSKPARPTVSLVTNPPCPTVWAYFPTPPPNWLGRGHSSSVKVRKRHIVCIGDMFHMSNKLKETERIHQKHTRKLHWFISESFRRDHELNKFYNRFRKAHWKRKAIEYLQSQGRGKKSKEISKYRKGCKDR